MLNATNFQPNELQLYNLLTGVMTDQPVTLASGLTVGGDQRRDQPALRVFGPLEVYGSRLDGRPVFSIAEGRFNFSHLRLDLLDVAGAVVAEDFVLRNGRALSELALPPQLRELRAGVLAVDALAVGGADPWRTGLSAGQGVLVVRTPDIHGGAATAVSLQCWSGNWLQFNVHFWDDDATQGWQSKRVTLDFDVDTLGPGSAGRITLHDGKVGIGRIDDVEAAILELQERIR